MSSVYCLNNDGSTVAMNRVHCADEEKELQEVLERNPGLLPGDQINPESPRRWLLVAREMSVPDPSSGQDRWSIDFVYLDQDAIPTFVECKRFKDTRSRREVVAQMLEYAANGHHYWTAQGLRALTERNLADPENDLVDVLAGLFSTNEEVDPETYFERAEENLREGRIRLVFFLEEAPEELKSIIDFLNRQMERTEVLLVEAKQYELYGCKIIVPTLFGYTEEARLAKRRSTVSTEQRIRWNEQLFFAAASGYLTAQELEIVHSLYEHTLEKGLEVTWGTGAKRGSMNVKAVFICPRSIFTVLTDGRMYLNFGWLDGNEIAVGFRKRFMEMLNEDLGWKILPEQETKYPPVSKLEWMPKAKQLVDLIADLVEKLASNTSATLSD